MNSRLRTLMRVAAVGTMVLLADATQAATITIGGGTPNASPDNTVTTWARSDQPAKNESDGIIFPGQLGNGHTLRGFIAFDLSAIPVGQVITSVTVVLYGDKVDTSSANDAGTLNLLDASVQPFTNDLTWETYDGTNAWTAVGGDFTGTLSSIVGIRSTDTVTDSAHTFASTTALIAAVQAAYDSSTDVRFGLDFDVNSAARNLVRFRGAQGNSDGTIAPSITIDYVPIPEPASVILLTMGGLCLIKGRRIN